VHERIPENEKYSLIMLKNNSLLLAEKSNFNISILDLTKMISVQITKSLKVVLFRNNTVIQSCVVT